MFFMLKLCRPPAAIGSSSDSVTGGGKNRDLWHRRWRSILAGELAVAGRPERFACRLGQAPDLGGLGGSKPQLKVFDALVEIVAQMHSV